MTRLPALLAALLATAVSAQDLHKEKFTRGPWETDIGYTQAIRIGDTLHVSGCVGRGSMPDAIAEAYGAIRATLAAYHLDFRHVVKETIYTTDIEALKAAKDSRAAYYGTDLPTATWVQVDRLFQPDHVIEVEVTAAIPAESAQTTNPPPERSPAASAGELGPRAIRAGNTLFLSGVAGRGAMPEAIDSAYAEIKQTLAAYHLDLSHVVKETAYTTDIEALKAAKETRKSHYGADFPTATWVQINRLVAPDFVLEVDVTAVLPAASPKPAGSR